MTIPQIRILEKNLSKIMKSENGEGDESKIKNDREDPGSNGNMAFGATLGMLKNKTGKDNFTMQEVVDPSNTLNKYKKV